MVQTLARGLDIVRAESRRHRLDALTLARQQQTFAIVLQRARRSSCPAAVARPSIYAAKRFSCGPGADRRDPTKQFYIRMLFYDPVVLPRVISNHRYLDVGTTKKSIETIDFK